MRDNSTSWWRLTVGVTLALLAASATVVLASSEEKNKKKIMEHAGSWPRVDLGAYDTLFVEDCLLSDRDAVERKEQDLVRGVSGRLADSVAASIDRQVFPVVLRRAPRPGETGAIVQIDITEYKPGNSAAGLMLIGLGNARLDYTVHVRATDRENELGVFAAKQLFFSGNPIIGSSGGGVAGLEARAASELGAWLSLCKGMTIDDVLARLDDARIAPEPETSHGTILFVRPQGVMGFKWLPAVGVDETMLGEAVPKKSLAAYVAPGVHTLWYALDSKRKTFEVNVEAGKTYYFGVLERKFLKEEHGADAAKECTPSHAADLTRSSRS